MFVSGAVLVFAGLIGWALHIGPRHRWDAVSATGWALLAVDAFHTGDRVSGLVCTGLCALDLYRWWHGGGGDGTRRRLRRLAGHFRGVRRTAPTTA